MVRYRDIAKAQRKETKLVDKLTTHESYTEVTFRGVITIINLSDMTEK